MAWTSGISIRDYRTVLSLSDSKATLEPRIEDGVSAESIDFAFRKNKLSADALTDGTPGSELLDEEPLSDTIALHRKKRRLWEERLCWTVPLLEAANVDFLVIKNLRNPYSIMADVDVLVPDPDDIVRVATEMEAADYTLKQSRLLCHPLKINAHKYVDGENNPLDVYPDVIWVRKKVADGTGVLERGQSMEIGDQTVPTPMPEDSFHIVGTHAFAHLRLTLAEVLHGLAMIAERTDFDWNHVVDLARTHGSMDSMYLYCHAIDRYADSYRETSPIPAWVLEELRKARASRKLESWLESDPSTPPTLPIYVPSNLGCVSSSLHYLRRTLGSNSPGETLYGTLTHYVILANQVI